MSHTSQSGEEVIARCETVLNATMAEMDVFHRQKTDDFRKLAEDYLDEEISLCEKVQSRKTNYA